jgi:hypothetical protein
VHEADVLVPDDLDLVDEAEAGEVVPELLLRHVLVQAAEVHVPAGVALADRQRDLLRDRARLAPADLELLAVEGELLDRRVRMKGGGGGALEEREEDAGLLGEDADVLERAEVDEVEELVDGRRRREVADVDGPVRRVGRGGREGRREGARREVGRRGDVEGRELTKLHHQKWLVASEKGKSILPGSG